MTFDQIVGAVETVASQQPQNLKTLLYILVTSDKAGVTITSARAPQEADLVPLADGSSVTAELVAEFHETRRVATLNLSCPSAGADKK